MKAVTLLSFIFISVLASSQSLVDTISLTTSMSGYKFIHRGAEIKANDVFILMENNEQAYDEFNASREAYFFGNIFGIIGSVLVVYPFANSALGNTPDYGPTFAGLCFIGISIPIFRSYNKKTESAIHLYNNGVAKPTQNQVQTKLSIGTSNNGVGLIYSF